MARPKKAVVDYFPHMVNHGKTMFTIESKYGNDGYAFYFKLLELLGLSEHHYLNCNDAETWEFLLAKTRINEVIANEILDKLAKLDSIDAKLWEIKIVRSNNFIQNLDTVYKRRSVSVINNDDLYSLCIQKLPLSSLTVNINPQSKVEYSKVNKSIENDFLELKFKEYKDWMLQQSVYERLAMNSKIKPTEIYYCVSEFIDKCYGEIMLQETKYKVEQYFLNWIKKDGRVLESVNNQIIKNGKAKQ